MNVHKNARLTPLSRAELVRRILVKKQTVKTVAASFGVCERTVRKWLARYEAEGAAGLADRSSRPRALAVQTSPSTVVQIEALRRQRRTGKAIAVETGVSRATVSRVLRRLGLNRLKALDPPEPVRRYERAQAGELLHIDIKKLGRFEKTGHRITGKRTVDSKSRGAGWERVHVAIDDASRIAFAQVRPNEDAKSAVAFLEAALTYYRSLGISILRVMTDNGGCYTSKAFAKACRRLGLKHIRTRPYTPRTNGKAERFIQTALREWVYANTYSHSDERTAQLPAWLHRYNWHRPHGGINDQTPISRLALQQDNLVRLHT
jgi:transposase InsO family protein